MSDSGHTDDVRELHREVRLLNQRVEDLEVLVAALTGATWPAEEKPAAAAPPPLRPIAWSQPPPRPAPLPPPATAPSACSRAAAQDAARTAAAAADRLGQGRGAGVHRAHPCLGRRRGDGARHRAAVRDGRQPRMGDARDAGRPGADRVARPARAPPSSSTAARGGPTRSSPRRASASPGSTRRSGRRPPSTASSAPRSPRRWLRRSRRWPSASASASARSGWRCSACRRR